MKYVIRDDAIRKEAGIELPVFSSQSYVRVLWRQYVGTSPITERSADALDAAVRDALAHLTRTVQQELDALLAVSEGGAD